MTLVVLYVRTRSKRPLLERATQMQAAARRKWVAAEIFEEQERGAMRTRPILHAAIRAAEARDLALVIGKMDGLLDDVAFLTTLEAAPCRVRFADFDHLEHRLLFAVELRVTLATLAKFRAKERLAKRKIPTITRKPASRAKREISTAVREAALQARYAAIDERNSRLCPIVRELRAGGARSLRQMAAVLEARKIETPLGGRSWSATQVSRLLAALEGPTEKQLAATKRRARLKAPCSAPSHRANKRGPTGY